MDSPLSWTDQHPPDCKAVANERHLSSLMFVKKFCFYFHFFVWSFSRTHGTSLKFHIKLVVSHSETKWNSHFLTEIFFAPHMVLSSLLAIHARGNVRNQVRKEIADCVANFSENEIVLCFLNTWLNLTSRKGHVWGGWCYPCNIPACGLRDSQCSPSFPSRGWKIIMIDDHVLSFSMV